MGKIVNFQFIQKMPKLKPVKKIEINNTINIHLQNNQELTWKQYKNITPVCT